MVCLAMHRLLSSNCVLLLFLPQLIAQPVLETGSRNMPDECVNKDTRHEVVRLSRKEGSNASFHFHSNTFEGNKTMFYNPDKENGRQAYTFDLKTYSLDKITKLISPMREEVFGPKQDMFIIRLSTYSLRT
jgi:oligogalacturonide lyase